MYSASWRNINKAQADWQCLHSSQKLHLIWKPKSSWNIPTRYLISIFLICPKQNVFYKNFSSRYQNSVAVEKRVYKNLKLFMENKKSGDDIFDRLNTSILNQYLNSLMDGLTAKVRFLVKGFPQIISTYFNGLFFSHSLFMLGINKLYLVQDNT